VQQLFEYIQFQLISNHNFNLFHGVLDMNEMNDLNNYKQRIKNDMTSALDYTNRKASKHRAEMNLISEGLKYTNNVTTFLDAPCGTGRATILLSKMGYKTTGVDLGQSALEVTKQKIKEADVTATVEAADIEDMPYLDKSFDAILCFRLYHHFPNDHIRRKVIQELCRVADKYVVISYMSPYSFTSVKRKLKHIFFNKQSIQHATSLASIEGYFEQEGFQLVKNIPRKRWVHTLHLAVFKRKAQS